MSVKNFIPTLWAEGMLRDLDAKSDFAEDCIRDYEGALKQKGDQVRIPTAGEITIKNGKDVVNNTIDAPERPEGGAVTLVVDQERYFNFAVNDVDKAQSMPNIMEEYRQSAAEGMAQEEDAYLASLVAKDEAVKIYGKAPLKVVAGTAGEGEVNAMYLLDLAVERLRENNVADKTKIVVTVPPKFLTLLNRELIDKDTDNSKRISSGYYGTYNGIVIKWSNNVKMQGGVYHMPIRTKRAMAFVRTLVETEAYRPERSFADAIKGLELFGGKIVRPKEIFDLNVTF